MSDKRKFVIHPYYVLIIVWLLYALVKPFLPPSSYSKAWSANTVIVFAIFILFYAGRYYVFSEKGIKVYLLGIRIRYVTWDDVKRLILFDNQSARRRKNHEHCIVVEKINCDPPFPEEGGWWQSHTFFLLNLSRTFKIRLKAYKWQMQVEGIEQFHEIDDYYTWEGE